MRTTVTIDDQLMRDVEEFTGIKERNTLFRKALEALLHLEASRQLAAMAGTDPTAEAAPRWRSAA